MTSNCITRREITLNGISCFVARTGYSGELGYELNIPMQLQAINLWTFLLKKGEYMGLQAGRFGSTRSVASGDGLPAVRERYQRGDDAN